MEIREKLVRQTTADFFTTLPSVGLTKLLYILDNRETHIKTNMYYNNIFDIIWKTTLIIQMRYYQRHPTDRFGEYLFGRPIFFLLSFKPFRSPWSIGPRKPLLAIVFCFGLAFQSASRCSLLCSPRYLPSSSSCFWDGLGSSSPVGSISVPAW